MTTQVIELSSNMKDNCTSDIDDIYNYLLNNIAAPLAEAIGYVVREDISVKAPSYNPNSAVLFISKTENSIPVMAISTANVSANYYRIYISGVRKTATDEFCPTQIGNNSQSAAYVAEHDTSILYQSDTDRYTLACKIFKFNDNRIVTLFYVIDKNTGMISSNERSVPWLISPVYVDDEKIEEASCYLTGMPCISYLPDIDSTSFEYVGATNASRHSAIGCGRPSGNTSFYGADKNHEVLLGNRYYIETGIYLPNVYMFTNLNKKSVGTRFKINNITYIVMYKYANSTEVWNLVIPEEV